MSNQSPTRQYYHHQQQPIQHQFLLSTIDSSHYSTAATLTSSTNSSLPIQISQHAVNNHNNNFNVYTTNISPSNSFSMVSNDKLNNREKQQLKLFQIVENETNKIEGKLVKRAEETERMKTSNSNFNHIVSHSTNNQPIELQSQIVASTPIYHSYPVHHHVVQQTEKLIIETRKLSVVESIQCNLPHQTEAYVTASNLPTCINYPVNSSIINHKQNNESKAKSSLAQIQSSIKKKKKKNSTMKLSKSNKKKKIHFKSCSDNPELENTSQLQKTSNLKVNQSAPQPGSKTEKSHSESNSMSSSVTASSSSSFSSGSFSSSCSTSSSSSSSSSDSEIESGKQKDEKKRKTEHKMESSSSSSISLSCGSSSFSSSSSFSEDNNSKSSCSSSSSSTSSSSSSAFSSCSDSLKKSSSKAKNISENTEVKTNVLTNKNPISMSHPISCKSANAAFSLIQHNSSSFLVDTILQQHKIVQSSVSSPENNEVKVAMDHSIVSKKSSENSALLNSQSDKCDSTVSPSKSEINQKIDISLNEEEQLKKQRDPAEERQRLRSYRIQHRSLGRILTSSTSNTSGILKSNCNSAPSTTNSTLSTESTQITINTNANITKTTQSLKTTNNSPAAKVEEKSKEQSIKAIPMNKPQNVPITSDIKQTNLKNRSAILNVSTASSIKIPLSSVTTPSTHRFPVNGTNHFLNSPFFVPSASTFSGLSQNFPLSSTLMPTIFNNQLLNSVISTANCKSTSSNISSNHQANHRFFSPTQSQQQQSQLTIFTSSNLTGGVSCGATSSLSPFSFPGAMTHPTLLSPQFSSSITNPTGSTGTPLSLNFSPNLSFSANHQAVPSSHPLMMLNFNSNKNKSTVSTNNNTPVTTSPPFILPRLVSTTNASSSLNKSTNNSIIFSKSCNKSRDRPANNSKKQQTFSLDKLTKGPQTNQLSQPTLILPSAASASTQHSPLSTLIPQTLLLFPTSLTSPFSSPKVDQSTITNNALVNKIDKAITISQLKNNTTIKLTTVSSCSKVTSTVSTSSSPLSSNPIISPPIISTIKPAASITSNGNLIAFSPNSTIPQLPYTLFSHQAQPTTLMQPISIQAPPPPPPSNMFGTPLLLSVISPNTRNNQQPSLSPVILPSNQDLANKMKNKIKIEPLPPTTSSTSQSTKGQNKTKLSKSIATSTNSISTIKSTLVTWPQAVNSVSPITINISNTSNHLVNSNTTPKSKNQSKTFKTNENIVKNTSPELKSPQSQELENLVRSVEKTINSFAESSDLNDVEEVESSSIKNLLFSNSISDDKTEKASPIFSPAQKLMFNEYETNYEKKNHKNKNQIPSSNKKTIDSSENILESNLKKIRVPSKPEKESKDLNKKTAILKKVIVENNNKAFSNSKDVLPLSSMKTHESMVSKDKITSNSTSRKKHKKHKKKYKKNKEKKLNRGKKSLIKQKNKFPKFSKTMFTHSSDRHNHTQSSSLNLTLNNFNYLTFQNDLEKIIETLRLITISGMLTKVDSKCLPKIFRWSEPLSNAKSTMLTSNETFKNSRKSPELSKIKQIDNQVIQKNFLENLRKSEKLENPTINNVEQSCQTDDIIQIQRINRPEKNKQNIEKFSNLIKKTVKQKMQNNDTDLDQSSNTSKKIYSDISSVTNSIQYEAKRVKVEKSPEYENQNSKKIFNLKKKKVAPPRVANDKSNYRPKVSSSTEQNLAACDEGKLSLACSTTVCNTISASITSSCSINGRSTAKKSTHDDDEIAVHCKHPTSSSTQTTNPTSESNSVVNNNANEKFGALSEPKKSFSLKYSQNLKDSAEKVDFEKFHSITKNKISSNNEVINSPNQPSVPNTLSLSINDNDTDADDECDSDDINEDHDTNRKNNFHDKVKFSNLIVQKFIDDTSEFDRCEMTKTDSKKTQKRSSNDLNLEKSSNINYDKSVVKKKNKNKNDSPTCNEPSNKKETKSLESSKRKRRRVINKTGFDKPRKRSKRSNKKEMKIFIFEKEFAKESSKKFEKSSKKNIKSDSSFKNKMKISKSSSIKSNLESELSLVKSSNSEKKTNTKQKKENQDSDFDSDQLTSKSVFSSLSSNEDTNDRYPIYMVTKPAQKEHGKKVLSIETNPFNRTIQSKIYYSFGCYSKEFLSLPQKKLDNCSNKLVTSSKNCESIKNDFQSVHQNGTDLAESNVSTPIDQVKQQSLLPIPKILFSSSKNSSECFKDDFLLNYELWFQHVYNPYPPEMRSAHYRRVKGNVFLDATPIAKHSNQICNCQPPKNDEAACGSDCINRQLFIECSPSTCPASSLCSNQRIQKLDWTPGLERIMTAERGFGIRTTQKIKKGDFILEYIGEIVSEQLFRKRMRERYVNERHHYFLSIEPGIYIDGYRVGNEGRFVNHSCEPNCEMQKWSVNGFFRIAMFAKREIEPMEELFYDYNFQNFNPDVSQECKCGSIMCRGYIGDRRQGQKSPNDNFLEIGISQEISKKEDYRFGPFKNWLHLPPNDSSARQFGIIIRKTKRINVSLKTLKFRGLIQSNFDISSSDSMVKINYDPIMLKHIKFDPLSHSKKAKIHKEALFLIRNFEKTRRLYSILQNQLRDPYGKDDSNKPYRTKNRLEKSGNISDLDTRYSSRYRNTNYDTKLIKMFSEIYFKVESLISDLTDSFEFKNSKDSHQNRVIKQNGIHDSLNNGAFKRKSDHQLKLNNIVNTELSNISSLDSFFQRIQSGKICSSKLFEAEMIQFIKDIFIEKRINWKKFKCINIKNENVECTFENNIKIAETLDQGFNEFDEIDSKEKQCLSYFKEIMLEKKYLVEEIEKTFLKSMKKELNSFGDLELSKLDEINQKKYQDFSDLLDKPNSILTKSSTLVHKTIENDLEKQLDELMKQVSDMPIQFFPKEQDEEEIRCICQSFREIGEMILCDKCGIWQHVDCVYQFTNIVKNEKDEVINEFLCEICQPRNLPKEIPLIYNEKQLSEPHPFSNISFKYYVSLESPIVKGMKIRIGDCVYIYRSGKSSSIKPSEPNIKFTNPEEYLKSLKKSTEIAIDNYSIPFEPRKCIILRVQKLAIIEKTNQRLIFGHHYIWPEESYREPSRKFYPNEVLRMPVFEWAPIEEVRKLCAVLDPATYVKGRPIGFEPHDVYICEMRVDRGAKAFSRIPKAGHYPINTKRYAFLTYTKKLQIKRTYVPPNPNQNDGISSETKSIKSKKQKSQKEKNCFFLNLLDSSQLMKKSIDSALLQKKSKQFEVRKKNLLNMINLLNKKKFFHELLSQQQQKNE